MSNNKEINKKSRKVNNYEVHGGTIEMDSREVKMRRAAMTHTPRDFENEKEI